MHTWVNYLDLATVVYTAFIAIWLLAKYWQGPLYLKYLGFLFVFFTVTFGCSPLDHFFPDFFVLHPGLMVFTSSIRFWFGPFLLIFVEAFLGKPKRIRAYWPHFILGGLLLVYYFIFKSWSAQFIQDMAANRLISENYPFEYFRIAIRPIVHAVYIFYCIYLTVQFRNEKGELFSYTDNYRFNWLFQLLLISVGSILVMFFSAAVFGILVFQSFALVQLPSLLLVGLLIRTIGVPEKIEENEVLEPTHSIATTNSEKEFQTQHETENIPSPSNKQLQRWEEIGVQLDVIMATKKLWQDPELDLRSLAFKLDYPSYLVSQAVNHCFDRNFNDYINQWRVAGAQRMLESPESLVLSIEGIGMVNGFKSKSVFYAAFKKQTDLTPNAYRQRFQVEH